MRSRTFYNYVCGCYKKLPLRLNNEFSQVQPVVVTLVAEDGLKSWAEMTERLISLPKPFSSGDVQEWFQRYDICCRANGWNAAAQIIKLPTLLEGEALAIWLELTEEEQTNYGIAKIKLISTMIPMEFVSLDEFHRHKLRPSESLSIYVHDLKKLLDQAMPGVEKVARDQLLLHQILAGLPEAVS